jgi:arabinan endo-1,5-alpha-L-arabinosidase
VVATDCPDPGVVREAGEYFMVCTSGGPSVFPIRSSTDLVHWTMRGSVFTEPNRPRWAIGDFWAPEIHRVGARFLAYFSARHADGHLAIGVAWAESILGPYHDLGRPLLIDPRPGVIDAHEFEAANGSKYLLWKVDGNSIGASTQIMIQSLAADGLALTGAATSLLENTEAWEGALVEAPWMIEHGGFVYLFYSANAFASPAYALGVARSASVLGPFVKAAAPLLVGNALWSGPGHGSVVLGPGGTWVHVFHAWVAGKVDQQPGREVLVGALRWSDDWPSMPDALSAFPQRMP